MLNLNQFMNNGIKNIMDTAGRFYLGNRQGQSFMFHMASAFHGGSKIRKGYERDGIHIPPFFEKVRQVSATEALNHKGGCTLFQYEEEVKQVLNK